MDWYLKIMDWFTILFPEVFEISWCKTGYFFKLTR